MERFCTSGSISTRYNHQCQRTFQQRLSKICMHVFGNKIGLSDRGRKWITKSVSLSDLVTSSSTCTASELDRLCCVTIIGLNQQRWLTPTYNFENKTWEIVFQNLDQIDCLSPVLNEPDGSLQASFDYSLWKYKRWLSRRNRSTKLRRKQSH